MEKFIFKYQKLLNIKKEKEDEIKNKLAVEIQKNEKNKENLKELYRKQEEYFLEVNDHLIGQLNISELKQGKINKEYFNKKIHDLKKNIKNKKKQIKKIRQELVIATQETKKYEKLKEKKMERYKKELDKEERKTIDEIVNYKNYKANGDNNGW